ncbi:hypothetical protein F4553_002696 [Allocatelliglobosispora scoriae]|uniref:Uncharacterized protein n=1 Tax=Allocatelliglobosispora scoriae TaxID=643052 RepID=A0A841BJN0_9ACTN|nr:hypothetical protein [Allocatelliglobosispora scoriae]MBB5869317.1 hypothetical protein [Allocatelliglobosispora scoriae]
MDFSDTFGNTLNGIANVLLKVLVFLAIVFVGWLVARALDSLVTKLLTRVGFDRLAERTGLRRWTGNYTPSALVGRLVRYIVLLFTLLVAFAVFGPNPVTSLINTIIAWLPRLIVACVIVVVAVAIANAVFDIIRNSLAQFSYGKGLARAAQVLIIALGVIAALNQVGIGTTVTMPILITALATVGGILIVGVGGGLILPMRHRWERILNSAETEYAKVSTHLKTGQSPDTIVLPKEPPAAS